ncbi:purine-nucleoside phosphorylase [Actinomyces lilanjuaniae]|uniref:purine-nucleoside phosphorylase n=1 Tax=Actinomyces lilanjuaniae TaxID=2321394 RepID=UPI00242CAAD4|nr:purine-nucleoside phosphorylase [Actinomyces lilanjuaniae]
MATPHIGAQPGDFAPASSCPGTPGGPSASPSASCPTPTWSQTCGHARLHRHRCRPPLSVMGSGMGQPSLTIYATELFRDFGVERIIRVGTAGGVAPSVQVGDLVVATGAHTDSAMNQARIPGVSFSAVADFHLARAACEAAEREGARPHVGTVISRDHFYLTPEGQTQRLADYGVLAVEMEAAALYGVAAEFGRQALAVLTVSDHLLDHSQDMSAAERETRFDGALRLAVAAAHS